MNSVEVYCHNTLLQNLQHKEKKKNPQMTTKNWILLQFLHELQNNLIIVNNLSNHNMNNTSGSFPNYTSQRAHNSRRRDKSMDLCMCQG